MAAVVIDARLLLDPSRPAVAAHSITRATTLAFDVQISQAHLSSLVAGIKIDGCDELEIIISLGVFDDLAHRPQP